MSCEIGVGLTTFPDVLSAKSTISKLLLGNLISCAQIDTEIESHYIWKGKMQVTPEVRVTMKFDIRQANNIEKKLLKLHPYETPQWVYWVVRGSKSYTDWIKNPS